MTKQWLKYREWLNAQFVIPFLFGWFILGGFPDLYTSVLQDRNSVSHHCICPRLVCPPCGTLIGKETKPFAEDEEIDSDLFRSQSIFDDETNRWRLLTRKFHFEMINQEPRVGVNGMWRDEIQEVHSKASEFLQERSGKQDNTRLSLKEVYRHFNSFLGISYIANFEDDTSGGKRSLEMRRFYQTGIPQLVSIELQADEEVLNIICPISKVTDRFHTFMDRYERNILGDPASGPIRLLFVIFRPNDNNDFEKRVSVRHTVAVLEEFSKRNKEADIEYIFEEGDFSRAVGIHSGVKHLQKDEMILFLDVDLAIGSGFISRIRRNTIRGKRVMFPITFSQYDPDIIDKAAELDETIKVLGQDKMAITRETGFWIHYAFGMASMYKSDYFKVGGFRLDIKGWGGEDVDLFQKMVADPDLEVMWAVDKELIHVYHSRGCDPNLARNQYAMCVGAWADSLGSQSQLANLYLDYIRRNKS